MIPPETLTDLSRRYPCILTRKQAAALCAEIGIPRRTFEWHCREGTTDFRFRVGRAVYHKYSREVILAIVTMNL